jgi:hypothetical protein
MSDQFPLLDEFVAFITERWSIHQRRLKGLPPPWTQDEILRTYRFTNVRREDDRVTRWISERWLQPHATNYDTVVFAMCLARLVNLPATLEALGYPVRWDAARFVRIMESRKAAGELTYNCAYIINAVGATKGQSKASYLAASVLTPLWQNRKMLGEALQQCPDLGLVHLHAALMHFHGFGGGFLSAQVVVDVRYTPAGLTAPDWKTFAVSGPGSRRGLNRLCGREVKARWHEEEWHATLMELRKLVLPKLSKELRELSTSDLQSTICEVDKYFRAKFSEGRPKQYFKASTAPY